MHTAARFVYNKATRVSPYLGQELGVYTALQLQGTMTTIVVMATLSSMETLDVTRPCNHLCKNTHPQRG